MKRIGAIMGITTKYNKISVHIIIIHWPEMLDEWGWFLLTMMNQASGEQASVVMKLMVMVAGIIGLLSSYRCQCSNRNRCVDRWILRKTHGWSLPDIFWGPKNNGMSLSPTTPKRDIQLGTKKWDDYPRVNKHKSWKTHAFPLGKSSASGPIQTWTRQLWDSWALVE